MNDPREFPIPLRVLPPPRRLTDTHRGASECPDGGRCHHQCGAGGCFRVLCCSPLSSYGTGDRWPDSVRAEHERRDEAEERARSREECRVVAMPNLSGPIQEKCTLDLAACSAPVYNIRAMTTNTENARRFAITFSEGLPADGPDYLGFRTFGDLAKQLRAIGDSAAKRGCYHKTDVELHFPSIEGPVRFTVEIHDGSFDLPKYAAEVAATFRAAANDPGHTMRIYDQSGERARQSAKNWTVLAAALAEEVA